MLELVGQCYSGPAAAGPGQRFGPTLVAEHLWEEHGILRPVPTLRRWMQEGGLWSRRRRSRRHHHVRGRREHFGELLQIDGSFHDWFEGRGPVACLMTLIDDATGVTVARFSAEETTWAAAALLEMWIERYGVPRAIYADRKTVYIAPGVRGGGGEAGVSAFGLMCGKLGIEVIAAKSPEAKGRVERSHGTNQDRLVKKMRLKGIRAIEAANAFLETAYLPSHNARYAVRARSAVDFHLPLAPALDRRDVFCREATRLLGRDWVVRHANRGLHVLPTRAAKRYCAPGMRLLIRETEDGALRVLVRARDGREHELVWEPVNVPLNAGGASKGLGAVLPARTVPRMGVIAPEPASEPIARPSGVTRPAASHPWRRQIHADAMAHLATRRAREVLPGEAVSACSSPSTI